MADVAVEPDPQPLSLRLPQRRFLRRRRGRLQRGRDGGAGRQRRPPFARVRAAGRDSHHRFAADLHRHRSAARQGRARQIAERQYPDLRRTIREGFVRYAFTRFNIPYVVSIQCLDSAARSNRLSCREASHVAEHFLKSLRIVGGKPVPAATGDRVSHRRTARGTFAGLHLSAAGRIDRQFRLSPRRRTAGPDRVCANPFSDRAGAGVREFAVVHELGRLLSEGPLSASARQGRCLSLPAERQEAHLRRVGGRELLLSLAG